MRYGDDDDNETRQKIMSLIYNHFEPERDIIINTLKTILPVGVFQFTDTIWSYAFMPLQEQKEEIEKMKLEQEAEKKKLQEEADEETDTETDEEHMEQQYDTDELSAILSEDSDKN